MRATVAAVFPTFSAAFEGRVHNPYLDVMGWVTVGVGNKIDPIGLAMGLPWCHGGDPTNPADDAAILAGWSAVKAMPRALLASAYTAATDLRLTDAAIDVLVRDKAAQMDSVLASRFTAGFSIAWADLPADAQLGCLSMAWACGPEFRFPHFEAALKGGDFTTCIVECRMAETGNPGLAPRNRANASLFAAASRVVSQGLDPDVLHYLDPGTP